MYFGNCQQSAQTSVQENFLGIVVRLADVAPDKPTIKRTVAHVTHVGPTCFGRCAPDESGYSGHSRSQPFFREVEQSVCRAYAAAT